MIEDSLTRERVIGIRRMNFIRLISAILFASFIVTVDVVLQRATWKGSSPLALCYLGAACFAFLIPKSKWLTLRKYSLAFVDVPLFFSVQVHLLSTSDNPTAIAAFSTSIFLVIIAFSAYSLERRPIIVTALIAAALQIFLYLQTSGNAESYIPSLMLMFVTTLFCSLMVMRLRRMIHKIVAEQGKQQFLSRFFSPQVVNELIENKEELEVKKQVCTVMFVDIRNFTKFAESTESKELFRVINEYNQIMVDCIFKYDGTLDKFLGDGALAYFGAPHVHPLHAANAVLCSFEIQLRIAELNQRRGLEGKAQLEVGIGIHSGEAALGLVGSASRREYTIIGDTVNLACRVEALTKQLGVNILVSDATKSLVNSVISFEALGAHPVKGRAGSVSVFYPSLAADDELQKETRLVS